jgi:hypothetical protein
MQGTALQAQLQQAVAFVVHACDTSGCANAELQKRARIASAQFQQQQQQQQQYRITP